MVASGHGDGEAPVKPTRRHHGAVGARDLCDSPVTKGFKTHREVRTEKEEARNRQD